MVDTIKQAMWLKPECQACILCLYFQVVKLLYYFRFLQTGSLVLFISFYWKICPRIWPFGNGNSYCSPRHPPQAATTMSQFLYLPPKNSLSPATYTRIWASQMKWPHQNSNTGNKPFRKDLRLYSQWQKFQWHSCYRWLKITAP